MLTSSFCFLRGLSEDQERALWARGVTSWAVARDQQGEVAEVIGNSRAGKLVEMIGEAERAQAAGDLAWYLANWPEREVWRLWSGFATDEQMALVDIETTGLTPGYDQITVIGLSDGSRNRAFVAGRPQPGDDPLDRFPEALKARRLLVTFNGVNFDAPFIERHFRPTGFRWELPHLDVMLLARQMGLQGGLKELEVKLGIARDDEIKGVRGNEAVQLWGQWKNGDANAYKRLVTYCLADCANLRRIADILYRRRWEQTYTSHARHIDFAAIKGQQLTLF
jgi:uncharacterized protein YprB with RNaseH-like and TPR domain